MIPEVSFVLDGQTRRIDFQDPNGPRPTTTVLNFLRSLSTHRGVKEGCAEGDCGACTVVLGERSPDGRIRYKAVDSCLLFLPMIHGKHLITVENLKNEKAELHPVQQAMVETGGSQCGYCTPGIIMSLFSLYKNRDHPTREEIDDALTGNLCRCTGYKPIIEAAAKSCVNHGKDHFTILEPKIADLLRSIPEDSLSLKTPQQQYWRPKTLPEALSLTQDHPDAIIISGATDIALRVTKKHEVLKKVIDLGTIEELKMISDGPAELRVGAGVSLELLMTQAKKDFPALFEMLAVFSSQQIRNLATLGGNLGTASPIGDMLPVLMAYNARVVLQSSKSSREVAVDEFFTGYRETVKRKEELITTVIIPKPMNGEKVKSYKISKRKDLDISTVSSAFRLTLNGGRTIGSIKLAYGGMAERPKRASKTEGFLKGRMWERSVVEEAMKILETEFTPIADARSGAEFRKVSAKNLLLKFWTETNGSPG